MESFEKKEGKSNIFAKKELNQFILQNMKE